MSATERPPSFQFYPRDFLTDRAVALMSTEARGGYVNLLCHAWLSDEPGILPDDDSTLAALSGLADRWPSCSVAIRRAFRQTSREGRQVLVQRRMVEERERQQRRHEQASQGGRARAEAAKRSPAGLLLPNQHNGSIALSPSSAFASSSSSSSASPSNSEKIAPDGADAVNRLIAATTHALSPAHPRAPLMTDVRAAVDALPPDKRNRVFALAGWLAKGGVELECVLRFVSDAIPRLDTVRSLHAYYATNGPARASIEGHYRADQQDRESKRWKAEEWAWARQFQAWKEAAT